MEKWHRMLALLFLWLPGCGLPTADPTPEGELGAHPDDAPESSALPPGAGSQPEPGGEEGAVGTEQEQPPPTPDLTAEVPVPLIYFEETLLTEVKKRLASGDPYFVEAYNRLLADAMLELGKKANPVTSKSITPPSGDKHDYLSIAPYWWPDPSKPDGLPWIRKDGQVNPATRGDDTDQLRLSNLFRSLELLSFAYYFSGDVKYATKIKELIGSWFIVKATRLNPNVKYGQGVPGGDPGRPAGIIEWVGVAHLVTALQLLSRDGLISPEDRAFVVTWLADYLKWLRTSDLGKEEDASGNNHGNWYDFQVIGMMLFLGMESEAKLKVEEAKWMRISKQIEPDGRQPAELARTKTVNYCTMNLWAMTRVTNMGRRVGVDLWKFSTPDGRGIKKAFEFLRPFVTGQEPWPYEQITNGGAQNAINSLMKPLFSKASSVLGEDLLPIDVDVARDISYLDVLQFPPSERLSW